MQKPIQNKQYIVPTILRVAIFIIFFYLSIIPNLATCVGSRYLRKTLEIIIYFVSLKIVLRIHARQYNRELIYTKICASKKFNEDIIWISVWLTQEVSAVSQLQTCRPSLQKWLWKVRGVWNRTGKIIKKISDFYFSIYHRKLGWFFYKNDTKMTIILKKK